jgi:hypothetical protein
MSNKIQDLLNQLQKEISVEQHYYNEQQKLIHNTKMDELTQLRKLAGLLQSAWHNGNWKAETYNEREMEKIMTEQGYWPTLPNPNQIGKMTPKQKAEDLWLSYYELIDDSYSSPAAKEMARGYARIAVDEILNNFGLESMGKKHYTNAGAIEFYEQVKQELENL